MKVVIPQQYREIRAMLPFDSVPAGYSSVDLFPVPELETAQLGYSLDRDGNELEWPPNLLVIGRDGLMGDPILIDTNNRSYPVYTAAHGEGQFDCYQIAASFQHLVQILNRMRLLARDRSNPVELENNPLSEEELDDFLELVESGGEELDTDFWESMFLLE